MTDVSIYLMAAMLVSALSPALGEERQHGVSGQTLLRPSPSISE